LQLQDAKRLEKIKTMKRRHLITFNIAGFSYYDGPMAFVDLKIGTELRLEREIDNKYDAKAVAIYHGEFKLGFIPRDLNSDISKFLEMGYNPFETRIQRIDPTAHTENQVGVIVYLKKNES
jgi:hypothetical protein